MRSRLVLRMAFILPIVSASNLDATSPSYGDSMFSNPDWPLDQTDQPASPVDQATSFFDTTQLPEEYTYGDQGNTISTSNENNGLMGTSFLSGVAIGDSLELPDCSSSEIVPPIGKSRIKRLNGSGSCTNSPAHSSSGSVSGVGGVGGEEPDLSGLMELLPQDPGAVEKLTEAMSEDQKNTFCGLYTIYFLPYGVCSLGAPMVAGVLTIPSRGVFYQSTLTQFTIGMLVQKLANPYCLVRRIFIGAD